MGAVRQAGRDSCLGRPPARSAQPIGHRRSCRPRSANPERDHRKSGTIAQPAAGAGRGRARLAERRAPRRDRLTLRSHPGGRGGAPSPRGASAQEAPAADADAPACDYLLVAGPGRSGSELLYERLKAHPAFAFPEIKEGYYYRSARAYARARRALEAAEGGAGGPRILADIANLAYRDGALAGGVEALRGGGRRILIAVLLRDHVDRAMSMARFRRSRGERTALFGAARLEAAVVRDRLTPGLLLGLYRLDADVLTIGFPALAADGGDAAVAAIGALCGAPGAPPGPAPGVVNESVAARHPLLSAAGKSAAVALRALGRRRLLQRLKDDARLRRLFFVPLPAGGGGPRLSAEARRILEADAAGCRALAEAASRPIGDWLWLRRAGDPLPAGAGG